MVNTKKHFIYAKLNAELMHLKASLVCLFRKERPVAHILTLILGYKI